MNYRKTFLCTLISLSSSQFALAQENADRDWAAKAELGFLKTGGNSDTETLNLKFSGSKTLEDWKHALTLEAMNSSSNDVRSSEKYLAGLQSDYALGDRSYFLTALNWEKDRFSSFDYQASLALGYGYKVIAEDDRKLELEAAPGYRLSEQKVGDKIEEGIIRVAEKYSHKLSETTNLDQSLSYEWGEENAITRFNIAVTSQVAGDLSMKVGYGVKHNSDVAIGADKTDTETTVTLVYDF